MRFVAGSPICWRAGGLSAASARKAVFALRQALEAAIADGRILHNPADKVPLPSERAERARYLSQQQVERLVSELPDRDQALVLVGAYGGLRWGEAAGLRRRDIDPPRSRIRVEGTAVQLGGTAGGFRAHVIDLRSGRDTVLPGAGPDANANRQLAWSANGRWLLALTDHQVRAYDTRTRAVVTLPLDGEPLLHLTTANDPGW